MFIHCLVGCWISLSGIHILDQETKRKVMIRWMRCIKQLKIICMTLKFDQTIKWHRRMQEQRQQNRFWRRWGQSYVNYSRGIRKEIHVHVRWPIQVDEYESHHSRIRRAFFLASQCNFLQTDYELMKFIFSHSHLIAWWELGCWHHNFVPVIIIFVKKNQNFGYYMVIVFQY